MMSSTIVVAFLRVCEQTCCRIVPVFILVLPDVIHLLQLQHLHYENHDELHTVEDKTQLKSSNQFLLLQALHQDEDLDHTFLLIR